jgi:SPP1 family predicted phage head-tail adaptor
MGRFTYQPGRFRYSIVLEQLSGVQDETGQMVQSWVPWKTVLCSIEQQAGNEKVVGQELYATVQVVMKTRFIDGIVPLMRATWGVRHFNIQAVLDPDGRRRWLTLLCVERPMSGQPGE